MVFVLIMPMVTFILIQSASAIGAFNLIALTKAIANGARVSRRFFVARLLNI